MDAIFHRRSVRAFRDTEVTDDQLNKILKAAMAAPSAGNAKEGEFIVFKDERTKKSVMECHEHARALETAPVAILICNNKEKGVYHDYDFWIQSLSAAMENMMIEATYLRLGSIWLGVYPKMDRVLHLKRVFQLPEHIIPFGIAAFGTAQKERSPIDRHDMADRVHFETYGNLK